MLIIPWKLQHKNLDLIAAKVYLLLHEVFCINQHKPRQNKLLPNVTLFCRINLHGSCQGATRCIPGHTSLKHMLEHIGKEWSDWAVICKSISIFCVIKGTAGRVVEVERCHQVSSTCVLIIRWTTLKPAGNKEISSEIGQCENNWEDRLGIKNRGGT